jgi:hypothetical protein
MYTKGAPASWFANTKNMSTGEASSVELAGNAMDGMVLGGSWPRPEAEGNGVSSQAACHESEGTLMGGLATRSAPASRVEPLSCQALPTP